MKINTGEMKTKKGEMTAKKDEMTIIAGKSKTSTQEIISSSCVFVLKKRILKAKNRLRIFDKNRSRLKGVDR
jgi:hypothetical protein